MAEFALRLVVGLGNPGPDYALTRHNAGFWFVDALARAHGASFREQRKYQGETARITIAGQDIELFKPLTFMNRSGLAVRSLTDYLRIPPGATLVVHDELDLPVGTVRLKQGGGAGGHNGLRDTIAHLGDDFWRLRVGVGHPGNRDEVIDYVLRRAPREEEETIIQCVGEAVALFPRLLTDGPQKTMNALHRKKEEDGHRNAQKNTEKSEKRGVKDEEGKKKVGDGEKRDGQIDGGRSDYGKNDGGKSDDSRNDDGKNDGRKRDDIN